MGLGNTDEVSGSYLKDKRESKKSVFISIGIVNKSFDLNPSFFFK